MNDTEQVLTSIWQTLSRGVHDAKHDWHWPTLATVDTKDAAQLRTVVLRQVNKDPAWIEIHSDSRACKIAQLRQQPRAQVLFYDGRSRTQLRASTEVSLHDADDIADQAWARIGTHGQAQYQKRAAPGAAIDTVSQEDLLAQPDQRFFTVLRLQLVKLDWLRLYRDGHQRVQFTLQNNLWSEINLVP
jgi:pyridoxamine 5'-phosphate oxidase